MKTHVVIEYQGKQYDQDKVVKKVKAACGKKSAKNLAVYIKPEEDAAYYVCDGNGGDDCKVEL